MFAALLACGATLVEDCGPHDGALARCKIVDVFAHCLDDAAEFVTHRDGHLLARDRVLILWDENGAVGVFMEVCDRVNDRIVDVETGNALSLLPLPQIPTKAGFIWRWSEIWLAIQRCGSCLAYFYLAFPADRLLELFDADITAAMESDGCCCHYVLISDT